MKQMCARVYVALPDEEFAEAEAKLKVKPIWDAFLAALANAEVSVTAKLETTWARTRPVATPGAKRGRKPKLAVPPTQTPAVAPTIGMLADGEAA